MSNVSLTTDHDTIKEWAQERNGKAAEVEGTADEGVGVLQIEFPGSNGGKKLKRIQWPSFFRKFDQKNLALLYQDRTEKGEVSRFCKIVYAPQGVLATLHLEHDQIRNVLADMAGTTTAAAKTRPRLLDKLRDLLEPHMKGEEKVVYEALRQSSEDEESLTTVLEGYEEHKAAKKALKRLIKADPETPAWTARLSVLKELIEHHIEEEENEMFDVARNLLGQEGLEQVRPEYEQRADKTRSKMS